MEYILCGNRVQIINDKLYVNGVEAEVATLVTMVVDSLQKDPRYKDTLKNIANTLLLNDHYKPMELLMYDNYKRTMLGLPEADENLFMKNSLLSKKMYHNLAEVYPDKFYEKILDKTIDNYYKRHLLPLLSQIHKNVFKDNNVLDVMEEIELVIHEIISYSDVLEYYYDLLQQNGKRIFIEIPYLKENEDLLELSRILRVLRNINKDANLYYNFFNILAESGNAIFDVTNYHDMIINTDLYDFDLTVEEINIASLLRQFKDRLGEDLVIDTLYERVLKENAFFEDCLDLFTDEFKQDILFDAMLNSKSKYKWVYDQCVTNFEIDDTELMVQALKYYKDRPEELIKFDHQLIRYLVDESTDKNLVEAYKLSHPEIDFNKEYSETELSDKEDYIAFINGLELEYAKVSDELVKKLKKIEEE